MFFLRGVLGYVAVILVLVAATQGGAVLAARILGVPNFQWFAPRPAAVPLWRRFLLRALSALAPFVVCVVALWAAVLSRGDSIPTTTVEVMPGPARDAGVRDGDRIVSVDGVPMESWEAIRATVKPGAPPKRIEIERAGERRMLVVEPTPDGRIGVQPVYRHDALGVTTALERAAAMPFTLYAGIIKNLLPSDTEPRSVMGPIGIVRASEQGKDAGSFLLLLGLVATSFWPWLVGVHLYDAGTLALFKRTHQAVSSSSPESVARHCRLHQALGIALACSVSLLLLGALFELPLVSAVAAPLLVLVAPGAVALYPLVWITARERWLKSSAWAAVAFAVGSFVPCVAQLAALTLSAWLRRELKEQGLHVGWFSAQRPLAD